MKSARTNTDTQSGLQLCKPVSPAHRRGVRWFSAITHAIERQAATDLERSLETSIQFYNCYAESGDPRYLNLCEDFLKFAAKTLSAQPKKP